MLVYRDAIQEWQLAGQRKDEGWEAGATGTCKNWLVCHCRIMLVSHSWVDCEG